MRICYSIILAAVLLTCSLGAPATALAATPQPPPGIQVTSSPTGLVVEWVAPETHLVELPDGASELRAEGYAQLEQPG